MAKYNAQLNCAACSSISFATFNNRFKSSRACTKSTYTTLRSESRKWPTTACTVSVSKMPSKLQVLAEGISYFGTYFVNVDEQVFDQNARLVILIQNAVDNVNAALG
eukprot:CAMPEP_0117001490 /NCGR_PEP_ID=MMETSP0472-20121206/3474_1 /TAXON_ID=693140 ORGANISM="Tiarina fusus, Strain LIS" /NCGR_SAMPLE_ID=MMETSP0472 /ASSEMBLY_ACC=CAM_ASM_000603 /LENGTH=106 /DNA_ID=CAMNT_0004701519 /DNA_START=251 /DNA_END=571 /DNA_ORIENTATION=+